MAVAGPPAGGFAASASLFALGLVTALLCLFLLLVQAGYRLTFGHLLEALASALDAATIPIPHFHIGHPLRPVARQVRRANLAVQHWIGWGIAQTEHGTTTLFHGAADLFHWTTEEMYKMGGAAYGALAWFKHVEIPAVRHYAGHVAKQAISTAHHDAVRVARAATAPIYPKLNSLDRFWRHQMDVFARGIDSLAHRLTGQLVKAIHSLRSQVAHARADVKRLRGITAKQARRLARLEKAAAPAATAAAVAVALRRLGLGWTRCTNVKKVGERICGMPVDELEALLLGALIITNPISIVAFAEAVGEITDEVADLINHFVHE